MEVPPTPPPTPQGLAYYQATVVNNRPASIMAISIIAIIFGALTVLCDGVSSLIALIAVIFAHSSTLAHQNQFQTMPMRVFSFVQLFVGFGLGGMLLGAGVGGVQLRAWARKLMIQWSILNIAFQLLAGAVGLYFALAVTVPAMQQQFNSQPRQPVPPGIVTFVSTTSVVGVILAAVILCIMPVCVLIFWRRSDVIEAFESPQPSHLADGS